MRIALYHNLQSGGAARVVLETVRRLAARHRIDLFCPSTADDAFCNVRPWVQSTQVYPYRRWSELQSPFGRLNEIVRLINLWCMQRLTRQIAAAIDAGGYDVVLAHPCVITQAPSILPHLRTPSVYYCHEPIRGLYETVVPRPYIRRSRQRMAVDRIDPLPRMYSRAVGRADSTNLRVATRVLTNSEFTRQSVRRIYAVDAEINYPGVDAASFAPRRGRREAYVLSVGALQPTKGFDFVIDSLATLSASARPALRLISNFEVPGEREYLQRQAAQGGVAVEFQVGVSHDELVDAYSRALLTAYAPLREPLGLAALESQACETPVVGVAEGGVSETIIDGQTGALVARDPVAFGQVVAQLMADPALRQTYGRAGRAAVTARWTWDRSTAELEDALIRTSRGAR